MKLLILCFTLCSLITFGQAKKQFIGGNINISYQQNVNNWQETVGDFFLFHIFDRHFSMNINPEFGISKSRRLEFGGNVLYGFEKFSNDSVNFLKPKYQTIKSLGVGIFTRHLILKKRNFKGFTKFGLQYEKIKSDTKFDPNFQTLFFEKNLEKDKLSLLLTPIVSYSITENIYLNCSLGNISYSRISKWIKDVSRDQSLRNTQIDLEFNFNASDLLLGVEFRL